MNDKDFYIKLTQKLYHLTLLFPKKEPLRYKAREVADEILSNLVFISEKGQNETESLKNKLESKLEILDCFFGVALSQNWVKPVDILEIKKEYLKIKEYLGTEIIQNEGLVPLIPFQVLTKPNVNATEAINSQKADFSVQLTATNQATRQNKIIELLKEKGRAQVWEFKKVFPEVTKRTLRRDFEQMLKQGLVERIGERNETFYLPRRQAGQVRA